MNCKRANDLLMEHLYGELDRLVAEQLEGHLRRCAGCSAEHKALEEMLQVVRQLPEVEPPAAVSEQLLAEAAAAAAAAAPAVPEVREGEIGAQDGSGLWDCIRAGMRLMVLHPAMTAAVVLVMVVGVSFYAYREGGPPSENLLKDELDLLEAHQALDREAPSIQEHAMPEGAPRIKEEKEKEKEEKGAGGASYEQLGWSIENGLDLKQPRTAHPQVTKDSVRKRPRLRTRKPSVEADGEKLQFLPAGKIASDNRRSLGTRGTWKPVSSSNLAKLRRDDKSTTASKTAQVVGGLKQQEANEELPSVASAPGPAPAPAKTMAQTLTQASGPVTDGKREKNKDSSRDKSKKRSSGTRARAAVTRAPQATVSSGRSASDEADGVEQRERGKRGRKREDAGYWLALAKKASSAKKCSEAMRFADRALQLRPKQRQKVADVIRPCLGRIVRQGKAFQRKAQQAHPRLAGFIVAEQARQESEAHVVAKRKAKKRAKQRARAKPKSDKVPARNSRKSATEKQKQRKALY